MIDLNKEAEECTDSIVFKDSSHLYASYYQGFIAGANSKYVREQIILTQIEVLKSLDIPMIGYITNDILTKIKELREQLKQLK